MVEVRLFAHLPDICVSRQRRVMVPYRDGLTVRDLLDLEGIAGEDLAVMVNSRQSSPEVVLSEGDYVFFLPAVAGGA
ncbi:MAG: MoaD/ThiS family protein [Dehalococcoidia bacterium]|nr:MoaD/ThiS family protein [Dehalococcoidia bacterium]